MKQFKKTVASIGVLSMVMTAVVMPQPARAAQLDMFDINTAGQFSDAWNEGVGVDNGTFYRSEDRGLSGSGAVVIGTTTAGFYVSSSTYPLPTSEGDMLTISAYVRYEEVGEGGGTAPKFALGFMASSSAEMDYDWWMPELTEPSLGMSISSEDYVYFTDQDSSVGYWGEAHFPDLVPGEWYKIVYALESTDTEDVYNVHIQIWNSDEDGELYSLRIWEREEEVEHLDIALLDGDNGFVHAYVGGISVEDGVAISVFDNLEITDTSLQMLWEGSGTEEDPYLVTTCAELQAINFDPENGADDRYFELDNDVDCSDTENWNGGMGFVPISKDTKWGSFDGTFDGNFHTISNVHVDNPDYSEQGLFEEVGGVIRNLIIDTISVTGYGTVGALVAELQGGGLIERVGVENLVISGDANVGGLVGDMGEGSTVDSSYVWNGLVETTGNGYLGGLVSYMAPLAVVSNSFASVGVYSANGGEMGGLVGRVEDYNGAPQITNSYVYGGIDNDGSTSMVGGLVSGNGGLGTVNVQHSFAIVPEFDPGASPSWAGAFAGKWGEASEIIGNYYLVDTELGCVGNLEMTEEECAEAEDDSIFKSVGSTILANWDIGLSEEESYNVNDGYPVLAWRYLEDEAETTWLAFNQIEEEPEEEQDTSRSTVSGGRAGGLANTSTNNSNSDLIKRIVDEILKRVEEMIKNGETVSPTILAFINGLGTGSTAVTGEELDLEYGDEGANVVKLQTLLINQGHSIPAGATGFFLEQTRTALIAYQQANNISPAVGYFGAATRAVMKVAGLGGLWW